MGNKSTHSWFLFIRLIAEERLFSYFAWSTWDLGPCLLAGGYVSSHSQKKKWTFPAEQDEPNPSPAEISGTMFYWGWGSGQDHTCCTPPDKIVHEETPVCLARHSPGGCPGPVLPWVLCSIQIWYVGVFSTTKVAKGRVSHTPKMLLGTGDQFGGRCDGQLLPGTAEQRELPLLSIAQRRLAWKVIQILNLFCF